MIPSSSRKAWLAGTVLVVAAAMLPAPAEAGFFDFLFGGAAQQPAQPTYSYGNPSLGVRVNPRRKARATEPKRDRAAPTKTARQVPMDISKTPNWHLADPTLRRGDIVVLKTGILVFDGGRTPATREDFTSLGQSRLLSREERQRIQKMAGPTVETVAAPMEKVAAPAKEASLQRP